MPFFTLKSGTLDDCSLDEKQIDIWQFSLSSEIPRAKTLLNSDELERAQRFYFDRHRRRFTMARATLRFILAHYLSVNAQDIAFAYNEYGKPSVKNHAEIEFNLSHSGEAALLAVGRKYALGIDLEWFSERPYEGIAKILFSEKEYTGLCTLPKMLKPLAFFHIWAQKEAFIKACGLGLSYPTQQFDVPLLPTTHQNIPDPIHHADWSILSFMPNIACAGALCYHPSIEKIRYMRLLDLMLLK